MHAQQSHVLHNQGIHADAVQVPDKTFHILEFVIIYYCVDGDIYLYIEDMGVIYYTRYLFKRVGSHFACPVSRSTDINGVGTVVYGRNGDVGVTCRSKQLYLLWHLQYSQFRLWESHLPQRAR